MTYIPEGVYHGTETTGTEPMYLLAVLQPRRSGSDPPRATRLHHAASRRLARQRVRVWDAGGYFAISQTCPAGSWNAAVLMPHGRSSGPFSS